MNRICSTNAYDRKYFFFRKQEENTVTCSVPTKQEMKVKRNLKAFVTQNP